MSFIKRSREGVDGGRGGGEGVEVARCVVLTFAPDLFSLSVDPTLNKPVLCVLSLSLACIRLSVGLFVSLSLSVCLSVCLRLSVGLFQYHFSVCSVCPCVCLRLSVGLFRYHFSVCSVCPCVSLRLLVGLFQYHFSVCFVCACLAAVTVEPKVVWKD